MRSSLRWTSTLGASAAASAVISDSSRNNRRRIAAYSVRPDVFGSNLSFLNWKATNLVPVLGNRESSSPFCRSIRLHGDVFKILPELMASIGPLSHLPALSTSYLHAGVTLEVKSPGKPAPGAGPPVQLRRRHGADHQALDERVSSTNGKNTPRPFPPSILELLHGYFLI